MQHINASFTYLRGFLLLSLGMTFVFNSFFSIGLSNLLIILVMLTFLISFPSMSSFPRNMSVGMIILGNVLFFLYGGSVAYWKEAIINNIGLVSLFISVPLLSYPLRNGGYIEYMDHFAQQFLKKDIQLIGFVIAVTCVTSSFLNLGSIRVIHDLFSNKLKHTKELFAKSLIQGFSLAAFWSPYFAGVAITVHLVGVSFISFMYYGLIMVLIGFAVSFIMSFENIRKTNKRGGYEYLAASLDRHDRHRPMETSFHHKKGIELIAVFAGLIAALFLLEKWLHYNVLVLISLVAFIYPIIWSALIKKTKAYLFSLKHYFSEVVPNVHNESIIIISATFFSQMIRLTDFPNLLSEWFASISQFSVFFTVLIIIATSVVTAFFIHQILPISVFATTLLPEEIGLKPELFALALVVSWGLIPLLSPVSAANLMVGKIFATKTFEIGLWNLKYALVLILLSSIAISVMNQFAF